MKPNFFILWVDDTKTFVESVQDPILELLTGKGFTVKIDWHKSEAGVLDRLKDTDVDLIVVDYNLPKTKGDELIEKIRSKNYCQDIVFYSQDGRPDDPFKQNPPDGVFFAKREDAKDRIKRIISYKMKRLSDIVFFRGWVVADAIELEKQLETVLCRCFPDKQHPLIRRFLEQNRAYDFGQKHSILSGIINDSITELSNDKDAAEKVKALSECKKVLNCFADEVIEIRNTAAHQASEYAADGIRKIKSRRKLKAEVLVTEEECAKIRRKLQGHKANFDKLLTLLP